MISSSKTAGSSASDARRVTTRASPDPREHRDRPVEVGDARGDAADDLDLAGHPHQGSDGRLAERDPDQHQPAPRDDQVRRGLKQRSVPRALDDCGDRAGEAAHLADLRHAGGGAEIEGDVAAVRDRVDTDDRRDASGTERGNGEQSDRPEPDHDGAVTSVEPRAFHAVYRHRQRLDETRVLERQPRGEAMEQRRRHRHELGEAPVAGEADSRRQRHRAAVGRAVPAVVADPAGDLRIDHRLVAGAPAGDAVADGIDHAGNLVAGDGVGEEPHLVRAEVRPADPAPVDADDDLAGDRFRMRERRRARAGARRPT